MLLEELQGRGRALERQLALALALPKDDAPANALGTFVGMSSAVRRARTPVANVTLPHAARLTGRTVPVLLAALLAGPAVPSFAARNRIVTSVPPGETLNLEPCSYDTGLQVHIGPAEAQGLALTDTRASATDHRAPFLLVAATSRMCRASSRVRGSISCGDTEGASTSVATFRKIRPRRTAILRARERMRSLGFDRGEVLDLVADVAAQVLDEPAERRGKCQCVAGGLVIVIRGWVGGCPVLADPAVRRAGQRDEQGRPEDLAVRADTTRIEE